MPAQQMTDLLRLTEQFHERLAQYFHELESDVQREEIRQALEFMSQHEQCIKTALEEYERTAPKSVANAWFKNFPEFRLPDALRDNHIDPDVSPEGLIDLAISLDASLITLYRQLAARDLPDSLHEAIQAVLDLEREEEKRIIRGVQDMQ